MSQDRHATRWSRTDSFAWVGLTYLLSLTAALLFAGSTTTPLASLIAAYIASILVVWGFSMRFDNSSFFDPYWSVAPPLIALYWIEHAESASSVRQAVVTTLVFAWGIRLTWNWARGWKGLHHEDWRYVDLYEKVPIPKWAVSLFAIQLFPGLQVFLGCLALQPALAYSERDFGALDCFALIVMGGSILIETVADEQLRSFVRTKKPGDIMRTGLWSVSRHPNYLGEIGFWWGLFLFGLAAAPAWWWTVIGPAAMTAMFHFASIPMLDQRSLERRPGYAEHMEKVNAVIPSWHA